jgi:hypothetical protein
MENSWVKLRPHKTAKSELRATNLLTIDPKKAISKHRLPIRRETGLVRETVAEKMPIKLITSTTIMIQSIRA